jgi:hypothetical protein
MSPSLSQDLEKRDSASTTISAFSRLALDAAMMERLHIIDDWKSRLLPYLFLARDEATMGPDKAHCLEKARGLDTGRNVKERTDGMPHDCR